MPGIEQTIGHVNVRSHTPKFIPPEEMGTRQVPNPCNPCHTDNSAQWANDMFKSRPEFSPGRAAQ
jgi:hypothetical protein